MDILISNVLSESILDFGKWSNGKYTNSRNPWGKVMERSGLRFKHFCLEVV